MPLPPPRSPNQRSTQRGLHRGLFWATTFALVSCVSPTIPLPPPDAPSIARGDGPNLARFVGRNAAANAIIVVYNPNVDPDRRVSGGQADAKGNWECVVPYRQEGEFVSVSQEASGERSAPLTVQIRF